MTGLRRRRSVRTRCRAPLAAVALAALGSFCTLIRAAGTPAAEPLLEPDALVGRVLTLADERLALMPAVAAAKWPRHQPVADEAREAAVVSSVGERARVSGLEAGPVERLFALQIRLARSVQERLYRQWDASGFTYDGGNLDLSGELRPRLDRISAAMIESLYLATPLLAVEPPALAELARRALPAERWTVADRAALVAALVEIRFAAPPSLERARAVGVLRVGTPADYAPFSVAGAAGVSGAEVELARRLGEALSLRPVFVHTTWRKLVDDLRSDRFDIAVGGISVTPARAAVATFSVPITRSGKTAIGRCADARRLARLESIDRKSVAVIVNPGGTNEAFVHGRLHFAQFVEHADNRTIFDEILAGRADVMFTDETEVALATHRHPELCRLLSESFEPADKALLMARDAGWVEVVDPWLREQIRAGTPARLLSEYLAR